MKTTYKTIDDYISSFPKEIQNVLQKLREIIKKEAPDAIETISYQMPAYKLNGKPLVYFAAFKDHISLFPTASNLESAIPEVAQYRTGKGTLSFLLSNPLPYDLVQKIIVFRVQEATMKVY